VRYIQAYLRLNITLFALRQGCAFFLIYKVPQNSKCQKGNTKQVPYWGLTNIWRYCTKFIRHGYMGSEICALCIDTMYADKPYYHNLNTSYRSIYQTTMLML
jgi:hypothetical protein